jgi:hypothetical protein
MTLASICFRVPPASIFGKNSVQIKTKCHDRETAADSESYSNGLKRSCPVKVIFEAADGITQETFWGFAFREARRLGLSFARTQGSNQFRK